MMKDPACEVNEKGTNEKNDGNEVKEEGTSPPLDVDPNEVIEADEETLPYAEKDWQDPEQMEVPETWNQIFRLRYRLDRMTGMTRLRVPCGKGNEGALTSSVRSEQRTTASTGAVCTDTRNLI